MTIVALKQAIVNATIIARELTVINDAIHTVQLQIIWRLQQEPPLPTDDLEELMTELHADRAQKNQELQEAAEIITQLEGLLHQCQQGGGG